MKRILVVDNHVGSRESIRAIFHNVYDIHAAETIATALEWLRSHHFELLIFDVLMPGLGDSRFLEEVRKISPEIPLLAMSAFYHEPVIENRDQSLSMSFICKPFDVFEFKKLVAITLESATLKRYRTTVKHELAREFPVNVIGESPGIQSAIETSKKASHDDCPVILFGEPGSGRELFARQIHSWSRRGSEPFVKVDCQRNPSCTVNAEIFGECGASPGQSTKSGALDIAGSGSIFLNEAQDLPLDTESLIKTVFKKDTFHLVNAVGTSVPCSTRFFLSYSVCISDSQSFIDEIRNNDLAHFISIPPLRECSKDIPSLVGHYLTQISSTLHSKMSSIEPAALLNLQSYSWPGNVRELRNVLERIVVLHGNEEILRAGYLPPEIGGNPLPYLDPEVISFNEATECLHRQMIVGALHKTNGKIKSAAALLNLTPRILQHRIDKLNIVSEAF